MLSAFSEKQAFREDSGASLYRKLNATCLFTHALAHALCFKRYTHLDALSPSLEKISNTP